MPTPYWNGSGRFIPSGCADRAEETVRHLHENAGAVAGIGLAAAGAAMVEIDQNCQRLADDLVGLFPLDIGNKADATGVMLELWIVETLFYWSLVGFHGVAFLPVVHSE